MYCLHYTPLKKYIYLAKLEKCNCHILFVRSLYNCVIIIDLTISLSINNSRILLL